MLLSYDDVAKNLLGVGVPVVRERLVDDPGAAADTVEEFGVPVALKLVSPELVHKSDVGAVLLDVRGHAAAEGGAARLARLAADLGLEHWRILVQEMVDATAAEVFVGLKRDPVFGPIVVVGAGGKLVELLGDRVIAPAPLGAEDAASLIREGVLGRVLGGYRGGRDVVVDVAEVVAAMSRLPETMPDLVEADLNPLVVTERGPVVVDARIAVDDEPRPGQVPGAARPPRDLTPLFEPRSVVVVGASATVTLPGNRVLGYLRRHAYPGRVVVVHPTAAEIEGYPAVRSLGELEHGEIDLACVAVAASGCAEVVEQLGAAGVPAAVVLSSGFSEVGDDALEAELVDVADRHGIVLCGPNTVGVMSPGSKVHVSFSQAQDMTSTPEGDVAIIAQSGALGGSLASQAWERGVGIGRFVSVGNQAALTVADYLDHLAGDEATRVVAIILEGVTDGRALLGAIDRATRGGTAVLVLKTGRTDVGARAVQSHTGSLAGDYTVYRAVLARAGAVIVDSVTELLDALQIHRLVGDIAPGARFAVVSTSGGACSLTADLCTQCGFEVPVFGEPLRDELSAVLPSYAAYGNPVDLTGRVTTDPTIFGRTLALLLGSSEVDAVAVTITTVADPMAEEIAAQLVEQVERSTKPVVVAWTIAAELAPRGLGLMRAAGIPVFDDPARALRAVALLQRGRDAR